MERRLLRKPVAAASLALLLVFCGLLVVVMESEDPIALEEASGFHLKKGDSSMKLWLNRLTAARHEKHVIKTIKKEKQHKPGKHFNQAVQQQKLAILRKHENNEILRHSMRHAAARSTKKMLAAAMSGMMDDVKNVAANAAKHAAKGVVKVDTTRKVVASAHASNAGKKLQVLEADVALMEAAAKKATTEAKDAKLKVQKKQAKYRAIVKYKMDRAEKDFEKLKKKLAAKANSKHIQRVVAAKLRRTSRAVVRLNGHLKRKKKQLKKLKRTVKKLIRRGKKKKKRMKKRLKEMKRKFGGMLKSMKNQLKRLRNSKDISAEMMAHVNAEEGVITDEDRKLSKEEAYIKQLKRKLHRAHARTTRYRAKAKKRKKVLRIAHTAYSNLQHAYNHLQDMVNEHAKTVKIKGPHADSARDTKRLMKNVLHTVKTLEKESVKAIAHAVAKKAARAAKKAAHLKDINSLQRHLDGEHLRGIDRALNGAKGIMHAITKKAKLPAKKTKKAKKVFGV